MLSASSRESLQKVMDDLIPRVRCVISMINATSDPAYHCKDRDHFVSLRGKHLTSSSANADRPRDTLCLSAVSFNTSSAILLVTSASDLPLRTIQFCSVFFLSSWSSMLHAVINKIHWCVAVCAVNCTVHHVLAVPVFP